MGGSLKILIFIVGGGGFPRNQYVGGNCLKKGIWQYRDLRGTGEGGAWQKRGEWCFWGGGVDTLMHTMVYCEMTCEFVSFFKTVFLFIALVIDECINNALIRDCPSNDKKWDSKDMLSVDNLCRLSSSFVNAVFDIIIKYSR